LAVILLNVTGLFRGWVVPATQVRAITDLQNLRIAEAVARADEYKHTAEVAELRADILQSLMETTTAVGVNVNRILAALPVPKEGGGE
jgi:hypothetical protein